MVGTLPDYSYLRTFGCVAYAHHTNLKLDPRSLKGVLGYGEGVKGYRLWLRDMRGYKVITNRSVIFNEGDFSCLSDKFSEKIGKDDFVITEINLNREAESDQIHFEVEPHEMEPQNTSDVEIIEDDQYLEPANDLCVSLEKIFVWPKAGP